jgi:uncharacterized protein (DUF58 family)
MAEHTASLPPPTGTAGPSARRARSSIRVTFSGLMTIPVVLIVLLAAMNSELNLLYLAVGLSGAAAVVNFLLVRAGLSGLTVRRALPESATVGRPLEAVLAVANTNRRLAAWGLLLEDRPAPLPAGGAALGFVPHVGPGREARTSYCLIPAARGRLEFSEIAVRSRFPFGLFQRKLIFAAPDAVVVWPARGELTAELLDAGGAENRPSTGARVRRNDAGDFAGLKEYRPGDNPRMIHWRSSARRGRPVIREHDDRSVGRVMILLDTRADPADAGAAARRETAVGFAATLSEDALKRGRAVGLAAWDGSRPAVAAPDLGSPQRLRLLDLLALLADNRTRGLGDLMTEIDLDLCVDALVVIVSPEAPARLPAPSDGLMRAAGRLMTVSVADPDFARLYRAPTMQRSVSSE